jgi:dihydroorotate dehydrogenase electron transfer subunit
VATPRAPVLTRRGTHAAHGVSGNWGGITAHRLARAGRAGYDRRVPSDRQAPLIAREAVGGSCFLLTFGHREVARQAHAGQFVMMKAGHSPEPPLRRPFSIMDVAPDRETFTLFVKAVGSGSRELADLPIGHDALCLGPLGTAFAPPPAEVEPLLVAGGYGIAPLLLLSRELRRAGTRPRLFYGGRTRADLVLRPAVEALDLPHEFATDDGSHGHAGKVTDALARHLEGRSRPAALYGCGPHGMLRAVASLAERHGLAAQVSLDPWMGCGLGICLSCVVRIQRSGEERGKYRCACTEGPVFDAADVVWSDEGVSRSRREETGA